MSEAATTNPRRGLTLYYLPLRGRTRPRSIDRYRFLEVRLDYDAQLQRLTSEEAPPKRLRPLATSPTISC